MLKLFSAHRGKLKIEDRRVNEPLCRRIPVLIVTLLLFNSSIGFSELQAESLTMSLVEIVSSSFGGIADSTVSKIDQVCYTD